MDRRAFLKSGLAAAAGVALTPGLVHRAHGAPARPGAGPYGPLLPPDANGVRLPAGFRSRILAEAEQPVAGTNYVWHTFPDGGATFPSGDGGWVYVSNSEVPGGGGAGALRFSSDGTVVDGYRILTGTSLNCAGGPTPWGTWLSCEETPLGRVWECDPKQPGQGIVRPALGTFSHEAVAVDPDGKRLYLTEDDGTDDSEAFYRFTPDRYPDLGAGTLEVAMLNGAGRVTWTEVDPLAPARQARVAGAAVFDGGEGVWYDAGHVYFTTKETNRVWDLDVAAQRITLLYDAVEFGGGAPLTGVDNVTMSSFGDIFVAEDGGNMELVMITRERQVAPLLQVTGHDGSEITGPAFDPSGTRLYFSSQRGEGGQRPGTTFEVTGPFRQPAPAAPPAAPPATPAAPVAPPSPTTDTLPATGADHLLPAAVGIGALAAAMTAWRRVAGRLVDADPG